MNRVTAVSVAAFLLALLPSGPGLRAAEPAKADGPRISVDEVNYNFGRIPEDRSVEHVFKVSNVGTKPLVIARVTTSCGCTAAMMESSVIDPGKTEGLRVSVKSRTRQKVTTRSISVRSNDPEHPILQIMVSYEVVAPDGEAKVEQPDKRAHPLEEKLTFARACLKCHGPSSSGQQGEKLYAAACAACHGAKGEGLRIPDEVRVTSLRLSALSVKTPAGLTQVISAGTGHPWMPGFGKSYGGPLDDAQIASLVERIIKGFPPR